MDEQNNKPSDSNKTYAYIGAGIVLLIIIIWAVYVNINRNNGINNNTQQVSQGTNPSDNTLATSTPAATPTGGTAIAKKLSYGDAVKAYPERFQFLACRGTPATMAVKKGTPVMLDNRDPIAHTIKADTQTFRLGGYGYDVFYPETLGNLAVTCDGTNRVMLNVEK